MALELDFNSTRSYSPQNLWVAVPDYRTAMVRLAPVSHIAQELVRSNYSDNSESQDIGHRISARHPGRLRGQRRSIRGVLIKPVSKRVNLTIPNSICLDLEDWAKQQGRPLANLANFLCETAVLQARADGSYTPSAAREAKAASEEENHD